MTNDNINEEIIEQVKKAIVKLLEEEPRSEEDILTISSTLFGISLGLLLNMGHINEDDVNQMNLTLANIVTNKNEDTTNGIMAPSPSKMYH